MAKILAFAGSNASTSMNFKLVKYSAGIAKTHDVELLDMSNLSFPMYSEDLEKADEFPDSVIAFKKKIEGAQGILISVNEHNGYVSAYFKNLLDWLSRLDRSFLEGKKVFLMGTSPGKRGAIGSLEAIAGLLPRFGAEMSATFSLPSFYDNFKVENGITAESLSKTHSEAMDAFINSL
ncbi:MAG: NADPH-dependent FMN reductase [Flavobacteriaceae bacterium]|nr:MAG: NADPH-dependent FMN reductase [Flavobacteriaceae bacterium]